MSRRTQSLNKIWKISRHTFVVNVRRLGFILVTLLVPGISVLALIVMAFFSAEAQEVIEGKPPADAPKIGIYDATGRYRTLPAKMGERFTTFDEESTAKTALLEGRLGGLVLIPKDYVETGTVSLWFTNYRSLFGYRSAEGELRNMLVTGLLKGRLDDQVIQRVHDPLRIDMDILDAAGRKRSVFDVMSDLMSFMVSVLLIVCIFFSSGHLLNSLTEEKDRRVLELLLSSVTPRELLAGKVIGLTALGLAQFCVWIATGFVLSGGAFAIVTGYVLWLNPQMFLLAGLYFFLGNIIFALLMMAVAAVGTNESERMILGSIFLLPALAPYVLMPLLLSNSNTSIDRVLSFFPLSAPTMIMLRLPLGGVPLVDLIGSLAILLLTIPLLFWVVSKLFQTGLLLYGKRPGVRELLRAFRQA